MKIYRDCVGIPLCPGCSNTIPTGTVVGCTTASSGFTTSIIGATGTFTGVNYGNFTLNAVVASSGIDIIQTCTSVRTICTNCNTRTAGTYSPGIEVFTYEGNVNLSAIPTACCKVVLGASICCRNNALTTMQAGNFYTEAILDRCQTSCNSAPIFSNEAVVQVCSGVDYIYNLGAIDPDGDSLSYAFAPSLQSANTNVSYVVPYSPGFPFPYFGAPNANGTFPLGLRIDSSTGEVKFRPLGTFVSYLVIGVTQWRKIGGVWTNVGYTRRDVQIHTQLCSSNSAPKIKIFKEGLIQTTSNFNTVGGVPFCLDIVCQDQPISGGTVDTTDLTWNNPGLYSSAMSNATFTRNYILAQRGINGPKADSFKFCWTPPISAIRNTPYSFTVNGIDRFCPIRATIISGINITVKAPTQISIDTLVTKRIFCNDRITNTNVKYQTSSVSLTSGNLFTVQLSDSLGSFNNATTIGSKISADTVGLIVVTIPANLPLNKNYKIRVNCSSDTSFKGIDLPISMVNGFAKPTITSSKDSICNGSTASLQASPTSNNFSYRWLNNNQIISNATNTSLVVNNDSNYRVIVSNTGCTDTSLVKKITILPKPIANIGTNTICTSLNAVNINNSSTIASGTMSYNWIFSDNTTSTDFTPTKIFTNPGTINATLVVLSNFNCKDSITKPITINNTPKANFNINDTLQCITGNRFTLLNSSVGGSTYNWNFGDNTSNNNINNNKVYTNAGNYAIKLIASSSNGCNDSIVKNVNVVAKATNIDFSVNQMSQCLRGNNFVFTNNSTPNNTTLSYLWIMDGATISTNRNPANFSTNKVGVIPVVLVVVANGKCIDTIAKNIIVNANPTIGNILGNVNPNSSLIPFTYSVLNQANSTYNWTTTNATIQSGQGTNQISVLFTNSGIAKIAAQITDINSCTDSTSLNISVTVGVNELSLENDLKVYPNPTKSILTITNKTNMLGKKYIITNLIGQTVLTGKLNLDETIINTESLTNGVYLLSIDGLNKQAIKVIKE
ncbi:MAG: T9SS type A sorting domain-containing protein [Bacteroidia bacterium]|nr:T9SS type A sorting domain-containing protein [Bacteroidia bacterium]